MAMLAILASFCLASTYDTLPSPTYLKIWRIVTEATIANILGACKVSLLQGRYVFRHDTVLHQLIQVLKTLISSIKEAIPISAKSSIKFV